MITRKHHHAKPAVALGRFCLSCAGTLACWCVWIVLGALLGVQLYIAVAQELPVPPALMRRFEGRLAEMNLGLAFGRAQFDPAGRLLLQDVRVRSGSFEDPVLLARSVYLRKSVLSILSGDRAPDEIRVDGATLQLPAPLSPTGTPEPLLRELAATLRLGREVVHVDQLAFRFAGATVTLRGDFAPPPRPAGAPPPDPAAVLGQVLQAGRALIRALPQLDLLEHPALDGELSVRPGIGNVAELTLTADALRRPAGRPLETGRLRATATLRLDGREPRPLRLSFVTDRAAYDGDRVTAEHLEGVASLELALRAPAVPPEIDLRLAADRVAGFGETVGQPVLHLQWRREGAVTAELAFASHGAVLGLAADADPARRTAELRFAGTVPPALVDDLLGRHTPRAAPFFRFGDPVRGVAVAHFAEGWRFSHLAARVRGGRLDSNGVEVTSTRGRIDIDRAGNFLAHDAFVQAGGNHARGSYAMNFRTQDYRMLLTGALHPPHIAGWFRGPWWREFWAKNFSFDGPPPVADVDVDGNWRRPQTTAYFGSTDAAAVRVLGADLETAHARVFVRPHFAHAFDLRAVRAGGTQRASGAFKRRADDATRRLERMEFDLAGNFDAAALRALGGPTAETLLERWQFNAPPQIEFRGHTDYTTGRALSELTFRGRIEGGARYGGFPLESVATTGRVQGTDVRLDEIDLRLAGGRGTGRALVDGPEDARRLGFDFYLENADLVRAIGVLHDYNRANATEPVEPTNPELLKRASGGRLQFALSAEGRPESLASFRGEGNLEIAGAELGEIHLFGLLSQLLSGLSLNFSSLKLDTLRGRYKLADGRVSFADLRVTGPTALIEGRGDYRLTDQTLDFTARFRPYEANRNLITGVIGMVMNPLTSILELRLTGPIRKPNWSISLGQSTPRESAPPAAPAAQSPASEPAPVPPKSGGGGSR